MQVIEALEEEHERDSEVGQGEQEKLLSTKVTDTERSNSMNNPVYYHNH